MSVKNFAAQMQGTIMQLKSNGTAAIYCDHIISYLQSVIDSPEVEPTAATIEQYKADMQSRIEYHKQLHESNLEMFRSVITAGQNAIKSSLLLNGGAAIAMLAFIANTARDNSQRVSYLASSLEPFAYGALAIVVTSGLTYLAQVLFANEKTRKFGRTAQVACIILGTASYGCFVWGLWRTYAILKGFPVP